MERLGSEEIAHILCGAVEEEVSCDTGNLQPTDPHHWALDPAALLLPALLLCSVQVHSLDVWKLKFGSHDFNASFLRTCRIVM